METRAQFRHRVQDVLNDIGRDTLSYDENEFWMIQSIYEYIEYHAVERRLFNTSIALSLARGLHNGGHRKSSIVKDGVSYRLPYVIHPLSVCRMLLELPLTLPNEEIDIVLAAALCHDMIEDIPFPLKGKELYQFFHLDKRVYETVKQVSKRRDFTEQEELDFFHGIETHPLALLVKLSDRGNNVEDLYNMSIWKVHEYVGETNRLFLPMCAYAEEHYPDQISSFRILKEKIITLTEAAEILVDRNAQKEQKLIEQVRELREENAKLREQFRKLWDKE